MPRDKRLFMTFTNDFWQHPKIAPLSDAAFRAFVELNGYSRMQDLDGRVPILLARRQWKTKALAELLANHPERPSLTVAGDDYVIWNYSEHQQTREDRERTAEVSRTNGAKGGRPRKNPDETQPGSDSNLNRTQRKAESESESESELEDQDLTTSGPVTHPPSYPQDRSTGDQPEVDLGKVKLAVQQHCGRLCTDAHALQIVGTVLVRSKSRAKNKTAFVVRAIENDPFEWQQLIDEAAA